LADARRQKGHDGGKRSERAPNQRVMANR
jgi:hypothetical protein